MVVWCILSSSSVNIFLIFLSLSIVAQLANWDYRALMALSCLALVSLASILTFTMQQLSMKLGGFGKGLAISGSESVGEFLVSLPSRFM